MKNATIILDAKSFTKHFVVLTSLVCLAYLSACSAAAPAAAPTLNPPASINEPMPTATPTNQSSILATDRLNFVFVYTRW